jgi:hypothetical protein
MTTLEEAGYSYNPFTSNDIWGQPRSLGLHAERAQTLPAGLDSSAFPALSTPGLAYDTTQGSGRKPFHKQTRMEQEMSTGMVTTGIFIAVMAAAVFWTKR